MLFMLTSDEFIIVIFKWVNEEIYFKFLSFDFEYNKYQ